MQLNELKLLIKKIINEVVTLDKSKYAIPKVSRGGRKPPGGWSGWGDEGGGWGEGPKDFIFWVIIKSPHKDPKVLYYLVKLAVNHGATWAEDKPENWWKQEEGVIKELVAFRGIYAGNNAIEFVNEAKRVCKKCKFFGVTQNNPSPIGMDDEEFEIFGFDTDIFLKCIKMGRHFGISIVLTGYQGESPNFNLSPPNKEGSYGNAVGVEELPGVIGEILDNYEIVRSDFSEEEWRELYKRFGL